MHECSVLLRRASTTYVYSTAYQLECISKLLIQRLVAGSVRTVLLLYRKWAIDGNTHTQRPHAMPQLNTRRHSHNRHLLTFSAFTRPACSPFLSAPCRSTSFSNSATRRRCLLETAQNSTHAAAQPQARVVAVVEFFAASTIQGNFDSGTCGEGVKLWKHDDHHDLEREIAIGCVRLPPEHCLLWSTCGVGVAGVAAVVRKRTSVRVGCYQ